MSGGKFATRDGVVPIRPMSDEAAQYLGDRFEDYLSSRGVTPDQAIDAGFHPVYDDEARAQSIATVRRHREQRKAANLPPLPGFVVDYGNDYCTFRYLCDEDDYPTDVNTKKPAKMPSPAGKASRPFMPPCVDWEQLPEDAHVWICESALKALVLSVRGIPAIGLNGVYTWSKDKQLSPELVKLFRRHRWNVTICFDANAHKGPKHNDKVAAAQRELARALYAECDVQEVRVAVVPYDRNRDQGVDDYCGKGHDLDALRASAYRVEEDGTVAVDSVSALDLLRQAHAIDKPIIENLINEGEANMLVSPPKCGKTRIAMTVALAVAAGDQYLFGHPELLTHRAGVILVALEDKPSDIARNLRLFADSMKVEIPANLKLLTELPEGSLIEDKLDQELKKHPDTKLVILDNHTKLELLAGRPEPTGSLVQREYTKTKRYTDWARRHGIAVLTLFHSKKGAGSTSTISDKANSTATMAAALDNLASLDWIKMERDEDKYLRWFSTQARSHKGLDCILNIDGACAVEYVGEAWDFDITKIQQSYVQAILAVASQRGDKFSWVSAKEIAETVKGNASTVRNAIKPLIKRGWVDSKEGKDGGYRLTPRATEALGAINGKF